MTQPFEIDLHSEFLRADLFLAMGQPTEAARILARLVEVEPANEAALEMLAAPTSARPSSRSPRTR
jgi:predicted Zn-dependent protease